MTRLQFELCVRETNGTGWSGGCICSTCHPEDGSPTRSLCASEHDLIGNLDTGDEPPFCDAGPACEWNRESYYGPGAWGPNTRLGTRPKPGLYKALHEHSQSVIS